MVQILTINWLEDIQRYSVLLECTNHGTIPGVDDTKLPDAVITYSRLQNGTNDYTGVPIAETKYNQLVESGPNGTLYITARLLPNMNTSLHIKYGITALTCAIMTDPAPTGINA